MQNNKKSFDIVRREIMQDAEDLESYEFRKKRSKELEEGKNINIMDLLWILRTVIKRFHELIEKNRELKNKLIDQKYFTF